MIVILPRSVVLAIFIVGIVGAIAIGAGKEIADYFAAREKAAFDARTVLLTDALDKGLIGVEPYATFKSDQLRRGDDQWTVFLKVTAKDGTMPFALKVTAGTIFEAASKLPCEFQIGSNQAKDQVFILSENDTAQFWAWVRPKGCAVHATYDADVSLTLKR